MEPATRRWARCTVSGMLPDRSVRHPPGLYPRTTPLEIPCFHRVSGEIGNENSTFNLRAKYSALRIYWLAFRCLRPFRKGKLALSLGTGTLPSCRLANGPSILGF